MLSEHDIPAFFASPSDLDLEDYVLFDYRFETEEDPKFVAANLCCEQSTAQWQRTGVDEDFRPLHGAKVLSLEECGGMAYQVQIAHPHRNFGPRIPNLLSAAAGEGPFYCPGISRIKWTDFSLPVSFMSAFSGPQFGVSGMRAQLGVYDRPLFLGVVKPNIGLKPADFAALAYESWCGGLDIAKDDEMLADTEWSPLRERTQVTVAASQKAVTKTGKKHFFLPNITDEVDRIQELYNDAVGAGASMVMLNAIMTGISALRALRAYSKVPIVSHFTGTAVFSRLPDHGMSSLVATKLQRLVGADMIILAGFGERMGCTDEEVLANIQACLEPWGNLLPALPVPGGSDSAETLPTVYQKIGHKDFGFICGRGIFGHPEGPEAGARSLHEVWHAIDSA